MATDSVPNQGPATPGGKTAKAPMKSRVKIPSSYLKSTDQVSTASTWTSLIDKLSTDLTALDQQNTKLARAWIFVQRDFFVHARHRRPVPAELPAIALRLASKSNGVNIHVYETKNHHVKEVSDILTPVLGESRLRIDPPIARARRNSPSRETMLGAVFITQHGLMSGAVWKEANRSLIYGLNFCDMNSSEPRMRQLVELLDCQWDQTGLKIDANKASQMVNSNQRTA